MSRSPAPNAFMTHPASTNCTHYMKEAAIVTLVVSPIYTLNFYMLVFYDSTNNNARVMHEHVILASCVCIYHLLGFLIGMSFVHLRMQHSEAFSASSAL